jgi:hypothetical protein
LDYQATAYDGLSILSATAQIQIGSVEIRAYDSVRRQFEFYRIWILGELQENCAPETGHAAWPKATLSQDRRRGNLDTSISTKRVAVLLAVLREENNIVRK